jgi:hypothetical protein
MRTDIHVASGIRTHNPSVLADEDDSCLRPLVVTLISKEFNLEN